MVEGLKPSEPISGSAQGVLVAIGFDALEAAPSPSLPAAAKAPDPFAGGSRAEPVILDDGEK